MAVATSTIHSTSALWNRAAMVETLRPPSCQPTTAAIRGAQSPPRRAYASSVRKFADFIFEQHGGLALEAILTSDAADACYGVEQTAYAGGRDNIHTAFEHIADLGLIQSGIPLRLGGDDRVPVLRTKDLKHKACGRTPALTDSGIAPRQAKRTKVRNAIESVFFYPEELSAPDGTIEAVSGAIP